MILKEASVTIGDLFLRMPWWILLVFGGAGLITEMVVFLVMVPLRDGRDILRAKASGVNICLPLSAKTAVVFWSGFFICIVAAVLIIIRIVAPFLSLIAGRLLGG